VDPVVQKWVYNKRRTKRVEKTFSGFQDAVIPDVVKQKTAFQHTWFSNNK